VAGSGQCPRLLASRLSGVFLRRLECFEHIDEIVHFLKFIGHASGHCGSDFERLMDTDEIVIHGVERHGASVN
jgi:hypothetical protein